jgi:uncharacterized hydrophobic protein (TIGR00271 family)
MKIKFDLFTLTDTERSNAISTTIVEAEPNADYFLLMFLSVTMATLGLFLDQATVVIGSMLIAPVISPTICAALGIVLSDFKLIKNSILTLFYSVIVSIITGVVISLFVDPVFFPINNEILSRTEPNMLYFLVAFVAGLAAAFAKIKEKLSSTLPGIAISTALVPPLAVVGIGVAKIDWQIFSKSLLLFLSNVFGIAMAAIIVFALSDLRRKKSVADKLV